MLETLSQLYPVSGLLHVGVGNGGWLDRYRRWNPGRVVLVEADEGRAERLRQAVDELDGYLVLDALVAGEDGEASFFVASNRNESGLVDPAGLTGIWRNLGTLECRARQASTIGTLLDRPPFDAPLREALNWLVVECLPSLAILRGAEELLSELDVVVVRAVADDAVARGIADAGRPGLDAFLGERGFRAVDVEAERHPAVCTVVYLRDWKGRHDIQRAAARQGSAEHRQALETLAALARERDGLSAAMRQKSEELSALVQARDKAVRERDEAAQARDEALRERDKQAERLKGEAAALREDLKAGEAQKAELAARVPALEKRIEELARELSAAQEEAKEERARLAEEFGRAEAQIDLIRSLVTGPGDA